MTNLRRNTMAAIIAIGSVAGFVALRTSVKNYAKKTRS